MNNLINQSLISPLLQAALVGVNHLQIEDLEVILDALAPFSSRPEEIGITMSTVRRIQKREAEALLILQTLLQKNPRSSRVKSLLASLMYRLGHREWKKMVDEVLQDGQDRHAVQLANFVLQEAAGQIDSEHKNKNAINA